MKGTNTSYLTALFILVLSLLVLAGAPVVAADDVKIRVKVDETYTTGSPVVINITRTDSTGKPLDAADPGSIKLNIKKPNGTVVESTARKGNWSEKGEYYDIFTIDMLGTYTVAVSDNAGGAQAAATFESVFATTGSISVLVLAVLMMTGAFVYRKGKNDVKGMSK